MQPNYTVLTLILASLVASAQSSAIKGHVQGRSHEDAARSIKLTQATNNIDKAPKAVASPVAPAVQQPQQSAPILESSKKVYNDESIRRSVQQQQAAPIAFAPVAVKTVAEPAAPVQQQQQAPVPVPVPVAVPVPVQPVVAQQQPIVPVVPIEQPAPVVVVKEAAPVPVPVQASIQTPVEAKSADSVKPSVVKDELPPQSDRSAPIKDEKPAVQAAPVVVEPVVSAKVFESERVQPIVPVGIVQPVQSVQAQVQPEPVVPVAQAQPEPIVVKQVEQSSQLQAKKDESVAQSQSVANNEPMPIDVPAPDPGLILSEPIDSTTKLLIDLDEHVQKFLPAEDKQEPVQPAKEHVLVNGVDYSPASEPQQPSGKSNVPLVPYSSSSVAGSVDTEPIVPPMPSLEGVEKASAAQAGSLASAQSVAQSSGSQSPSATRQANHQNQNQQQVITQLLDQLDSLQNRIQDTINQLLARRRYVMSALLRPMGTYVRRVRTNLERLQNRVNQLQAAAVSVGGGSGNQNRPGGFVDAAAIETIRRRIDDISKRISDIVNRIRFSLTPTSAPLNSNGRK